MQCCGRQPYDTSKYVCCYNRLQPRLGPKTYCCSQKSYNAETHYCCWPNITLRPKYPTTRFIQCCAGVAYDFDQQFCCSNKIYQKKLNGVDQSCCGGQVFDQAKDLCCWPNMHPNGLSSKVCCGGKAHDQDPRVISCCGADLYNTRKAMCCYKDVIQSKNYGDDSRCCGSQVYDSKEKSCCDYFKGRLCWCSRKTSNLVNNWLTMLIEWW